MKRAYRGFEIDVKRQACMSGYPLVYYSIVRQSDGLVVVDSFEDTEDTVNLVTDAMRRRVDKYYTFGTW